MTFTPESVTKILRGRKCATSRLDTPHWQKVVQSVKAGHDVVGHLWKGSPRNSGEFLYPAKIVRAELRRGLDFEGDMILKDGFDSAAGLMARLAELYEPTYCRTCNDFVPRPHFGMHLNETHMKGTRLEAKHFVEWSQERRWPWFEWENPPEAGIRAAKLEEVPLLAIA